MKTFSWCLDARKLKTEQKLIVLSCLHPPPYLFWKKIGTQSNSTNFLNWGDHVNSIPDLAARTPPPTRHSSGQSFSTFGNDMIRELPNHGANLGSLDARLVFMKFMHDMYPRVESGQPYYVTKTCWYEKLWTLSLLVGMDRLQEKRNVYLISVYMD